MNNLDEHLTLNGLMRNMVHGMLRPIADDELYERNGVANSPGWIIGHLILSNRFGTRLLGGSAPTPGDMQTFGPGSSGDVPADQHKRTSELLDLENQTAQDFHTALKRAQPEHFSAPNPTGILVAELPTTGLMLAHLLVSHVALHSGQLSSWRRSKELPSMLQFGS